MAGCVVVPQGCPFPLVVPDDPENADIIAFPPEVIEIIGVQPCCSIPCRGTMHTEQDFKTFYNMQLILSIFGVILSAFMFVTWAIFEKKRKQYMTFWMSVCSLNISGAFLLTAILADGELENVLCKDNTQKVTMKEEGSAMSPCVFQAAWIVFFAGSLVGWWTVQSVDLFRKLYIGTRNTDEDKYKYHFFAWAFPTGATIFLLATSQLGYTDPNPYCFVNSDAAILTEWASFYGYIALCFIAGCTMMVVVLGVIIKHANRQKANGSASSSKRFRMYRTPLLFVLLFVFVWANIFSFRLITGYDQEFFEDQGAKWVTCLVGSFFFNPAGNVENPAFEGAFPGFVNELLSPDNGGNPNACGETQGGISDGSLILTIGVVFSQSILLWLVFGTMNENFKLWSAFMGCRKSADVGTTDYENSYQGSKSPSYHGSSYNEPTPQSSYYSSQASPYGSQMSPGSHGGYGGPPQYGMPQSQYGGSAPGSYGGQSQYASYAGAPPGSYYGNNGGGYR